MPFFEVSEENAFRWYITSAISRTFNFLNVTMTDFWPLRDSKEGRDRIRDTQVFFGIAIC